MSDNVYKIFVFEMEALFLQMEDAKLEDDKDKQEFIFSAMKEKVRDLASMEGVEIFIDNG